MLTPMEEALIARLKIAEQARREQIEADRAAEWDRHRALINGHAPYTPDAADDEEPR